VSGARGFIGAATVRRLAAIPETTVVALSRSRPDGPPDRNVHWVEASLEDLGPSHWRAAGWTKFDAVIHLAAFTPKSAATRDSAQEIIAANIIGLQTLLTSFLSLSKFSLSRVGPASRDPLIIPDGPIQIRSGWEASF